MVAILQPLKHNKPIPIDRAVVLVGRADQCDVVITGSKKISRRHCCLVQSDTTYLIRDLGSTNGVWINGKRVDMEGEMREGDQVAIGDVQFRFFPNGVKKMPRRAPVGGMSNLAGSGIEAIDLDQRPAPIEQVDIFDDDEAGSNTPDGDAANGSPADSDDDIAILPTVAKQKSAATGMDEEERPSPLESEPVINLNDSFDDQEIDDIVVFDDE